MEYDVDDGDQSDDVWNAWDLALLKSLTGLTPRAARRQIDQPRKSE